MVHRRRTEQDEAIEGDDQEEGVQHGSAKPEKEEEGERYGPGAGDKLFIEYSTNPGFWEPGSATCVDDERGLIWTCGDSRIKAFPSIDQELPCKHTLQAGGEVLGLAIQKGRLYASVEKTIKFWKLGEIEGHKEDVSSGELSDYSVRSMTEEERKEFAEKYENRMSSTMLDDDVYEVEITKGQPAHGSFDTPVPFKSLLALPASFAGCPHALAATTNWGTALHVFDLERGEISVTFSGHKKQIVQISAAAGIPNLVASASWDASARVWDVRTGGAVCTLKDRCDESLWGVALVATEGGYPFCFTGGRNESVLAWDLRMQRSLYELSTGNNHVSALYWTEPSQSLLAITSCPHVDDRGMGEYYADVIEPENHREPYRWPRPARHGVKDFPARWDAGNHLFIRYAFTRCPSQKVPQANQPYPDEPYDSRSWF